jgi:hypothetical protein
MKTEQEIQEKLEHFKTLYWCCRKLGEKVSAHWYLAKFEALMWVLEEEYSRLLAGEMEAVEAGDEKK